MTNLYLGARSPKGNVGVRGVLDSGELSAYSAGVLSGFEATGASSWTLEIGGATGIQDVAVTKNPNGESELLGGTAGQSLDFIIGGAPGTPGQSRTDALVVYKDPFATSVVNDGIDLVDYEVVPGTPATTGTQVPPDDATIRATIPTGSLKFVAVIGYVTIAHGAGSVTTGNFTRNLASLNDILVPELATMQTQLDNQWWDEIGRTTLGSAGDTITVSGLPERTYLYIYVKLLNTGGTINGTVTFNGDSGANYAINRSNSFGAASTSTSTNGVSLNQATAAAPTFAHGIIYNISGINKVCAFDTIELNAAGAGTAPSPRTTIGKWANSALIDTITVTNGGTGDLNTGSELIVLGHD